MKLAAFPSPLRETPGAQGGHPLTPGVGADVTWSRGCRSCGSCCCHSYGSCCCHSYGFRRSWSHRSWSRLRSCSRHPEQCVAPVSRVGDLGVSYFTPYCCWLCLFFLRSTPVLRICNTSVLQNWGKSEVELPGRLANAAKVTLLSHLVSCLSVDTPEHRYQIMTVTLPPLMRGFAVAMLLASAAPPPMLMKRGTLRRGLRLGSRSSFSRTARRTNCERTTPSFLIPRSISGISSSATETIKTRILFFAVTPQGIDWCIDSVRIPVNKIFLHKWI